MTGSVPTLDVPQQIVDFLSKHTTMTLATASPTGLPRATSLRYASDGVTLYVWTRSESWTARQIAQNPLVSFTIAEEAAGLQGTGEARLVLAGQEISRAVEVFSEKFPMALGASTMNILFFRIAPTDIKLIDETYAGGRGETRIFEGAEYRVAETYTVTSDLPIGDVGLISGRLQRVELEPGSVLARQGGPADKFVVVIDGEVEVVREGEQGGETVDTLRAGDFFGEIAVMRDNPRTATLRARYAATVLTMDRDQFKSVIAQGLGVAVDFDRIIRDRLSG